MERPGEGGNRQSSLPKVLTRFLFTGPQLPGSPPGEAARLESTSEGEQRVGREIPYASHPVPLYLVGSETGGSTLMPASFEGDSGRGSRYQSRSPDYQDIPAVGSSRPAEPPYHPQPAPTSRGSAVPSDPVYYASSHPPPYSVPPPAPMRPVTWREGEAGPSTSYARQDFREEAYRREIRGFQHPSHLVQQYASEQFFQPSRPPPGSFEIQEERGHTYHYDDSRGTHAGYPSRFGRANPATFEHGHISRETAAYQDRHAFLSGGFVPYSEAALGGGPGRPPISEESYELFLGLGGQYETHVVHPGRVPYARGEYLPIASPIPRHRTGSDPLLLPNFGAGPRLSPFHSGTSPLPPQPTIYGEDDQETVRSASHERTREEDLEERQAGSRQTGSRGKKRARTESESPEGQRRKVPKKTEVACFFCRGRKLRCDGQRPTCRNCFRRNNVCEYASHPRRRGPGKATKGSRKYGAGRGGEAVQQPPQQPPLQPPLQPEEQPPEQPPPQPLLPEAQFTFAVPHSMELQQEQQRQHAVLPLMEHPPGAGQGQRRQPQSQQHLSPAPFRGEEEGEGDRPLHRGDDPF